MLAYDHFIWRIPKLGRDVSNRPDVRGTWRGTLASHWIDPETNERVPPDTDVYLVVRQTFWKVTAVLITRESKSCSTTATVDDDGCGQYQLVAVYRNTPRAALRHRSEVHHGSFKLDISGEPVTRLEGYYWTDRNTMGELQFDRRFKHTVESFADGAALSQ